MKPDYTWQEDDYKLIMGFHHSDPNTGRNYYWYRFYDYTVQTNLLFRGSDFSPSPLFERKDYERMKRDLLGFISLQPGDTDEEYFDRYNPKQLAWARSDRAENLSIYTEEDDELS